MQVVILYFFQCNNTPYMLQFPYNEKRTALCDSLFVPFKLLDSCVIPSPFYRTVMNVFP